MPFQKTKTKTKKVMLHLFFTIEQVSIDFYMDSPLTGNTILLQIIDNLTLQKKKKKILMFKLNKGPNNPGEV